MGYTATLAAFGRDDVARAGGKAANLGELVRAGLPVPPGFVVTTEAYRSFVAGHGLTESIVELSQAQLNKTSAEIASASAKYEYDLQRAVLNYQVGALK